MASRPAWEDGDEQTDDEQPIGMEGIKVRLTAALKSRRARLLAASFGLWSVSCLAALAAAAATCKPGRPLLAQMMLAESQAGLVTAFIFGCFLQMPWALFFWRVLRRHGRDWGRGDVVGTAVVYVLGAFASLSVMIIRNAEAMWLLEFGTFCAGLFAVSTCALVLVYLSVAVLASFGVKSAWRWLGVAARVAILVLFVAGLATSLPSPEVVRLQLEVPGLAAEADGYRLCHLSDLHAGPLAGAAELRHLANLVASLGCRAVVLNGDVAEGSVSLRAAALSELLALASSTPDGAYFVPGNHEFYNFEEPSPRREAEAWTRWWNERGVKSLNNSHVQVPLNSSAKWLTLAGIDDNKGSPDLDLALAGRQAPGLPAVLFAHQPWPHVQRAVEAKVALQFSGHTHGGQLWPIQPLAASAAHGYLSGLYRPDDGDLQLYVGDGTLGTYVTRFRLLSRSEVTVATLRSAPCGDCERPGGLRQASVGVLLGQLSFALFFLTPVGLLAGWVYRRQQGRLRSCCIRRSSKGKDSPESETP